MVWSKCCGHHFQSSKHEVEGMRSRSRMSKADTTLKCLIIFVLVISVSSYLYIQATAPYDRCFHDDLRHSHSDLTVGNHPIDRSTRESHLMSLDSLAIKVQAQYVRSLSLATSSSHGRCKPTPIIFDCSSGFQECGGLGDRFKGMASTFYLALLTNSRFYYHWTFPTDVGNFFEASDSDLSSPAKTARSLMGIKYLTMFEWWCMNWHCMVRDLGRTKEGNLPELWRGYNSVISHTNMAYWEILAENPFLVAAARRYNLHLLRQDEMFYIFARLYLSKLSSFMEEELEPFGTVTNSSSNRFKVGVQLRVGDDTAWHEGPRHSLAAAGCFVEKAQRKCEEESRKGKECLIFVSTDSQKALGLFEERFNLLGIPIVATNGPISHIDKPTDSWIERIFTDPQSIISQHSRVLKDWVLLTKMDQLYISRSGFSETAAFAGLVPTERMVVQHEHLCQFHPWSGDAGSKLW